MRHSKARAFLASAAAVLLVLSLPLPALAIGTADCVDPDFNHHWRGVELSDGVQKHGTSGTAEAYSLWQCSKPYPIEKSGSFVFSNVEPVNGHGNDIIQIGMGNCRASNCVSGMRYYSGWGRTGGPAGQATQGCEGWSTRAPVLVNEGAWANAAHDFKVWHSGNFWRMYVDLSQKETVPEGEICWTPKKATWFGENWDFGDQIGGTVDNKLSVTLLNYTNTEGGGFVWTNFNAANLCNYGGAGAPYFCDITGVKSYDIWSDR